MDATKKSARQKKREAHELSASPGPKKRKKLNDHQDSSKKRKLSSSSLSSSPAKPPSSFQNKNKKPNDKSKEESSKDSVNNEPPKQKKKMNKPKHLKRKIEQAKKEASADVEGASKKALELEKQQEDYQVKKQEAAEKFYQLCISLVGKEAWDDKKEALYQKLLSQGKFGCHCSFLVCSKIDTTVMIRMF